jgi:hypothetical protein
MNKGEQAMSEKSFELNDVVEMKKPHPCGENKWKVIRMGMDIRIKCLGCGHSVMIPRKEFTKKMKRVLEKSNSTEV